MNKRPKLLWGHAPKFQSPTVSGGREPAVWKGPGDVAPMRGPVYEQPTIPEDDSTYVAGEAVLPAYYREYVLQETAKGCAQHKFEHRCSMPCELCNYNVNRYGISHTEAALIQQAEDMWYQNHVSSVPRDESLPLGLKMVIGIFSISAVILFVGLLHFCNNMEEPIFASASEPTTTSSSFHWCECTPVQAGTILSIWEGVPKRTKAQCKDDPLLLNKPYIGNGATYKGEDSKLSVSKINCVDYSFWFVLYLQQKGYHSHLVEVHKGEQGKYHQLVGFTEDGSTVKYFEPQNGKFDWCASCQGPLKESCGPLIFDAPEDDGTILQAFYKTSDPYSPTFTGL